MLLGFWMLGGLAQGQTLTETLRARDGAVYDGFGQVLALSGQTLVVSSPGWEPSTSFQDVGAAYVFERSSAGWEVRTQLRPGVATHHAGFGLALAVSPGVIAVGSPTGRTSEIETGLVHVYELGPLGWTESQVLQPASIGQDDRFGSALDFDGTTLIAGAPRAEQFGMRTGAAFLYRPLLGHWQNIGTLLPPSGAQAGWRFGEAVAAAGGLVAVGSPGALEGRGRVFLYEPVPGGWLLMECLQAPEPAVGEAFGSALALADGVLAVGVPGANRVDMFETEPNGFEFSGAVVSGGGAPGFGSQVVLAPGRLGVVGSTPYGAQWVFGRAGAGWVLVDAVSRPEGTSAGLFGAGFALFEQTTLVGSPAAPGEGLVRAYSLAESPEVGAFCSLSSCPCGNLGDAGGCMNSSGRGARLSAWGSLSVEDQDLCLVLDHGPANRMAVLCAGAQEQPSFFGDGVLCLGSGAGALGSVRVIAALDLDVAGRAEFQVPHPFLALAARSGTKIKVQALLRDPGGPCGAGFNSSNGLVLEARL